MMDDCRTDVRLYDDPILVPRKRRDRTSGIWSHTGQPFEFCCRARHAVRDEILGSLVEHLRTTVIPEPLPAFQNLSQRCRRELLRGRKSLYECGIERHDAIDLRLLEHYF